MGIDTPKWESQDLNSLLTKLSNQEKDKLLETLKKDKWEREALIIKKLEEKYEKVRKLWENKFLVKNNNELRMLVNSDWNELYKGLRFEGRFVKWDLQILKLLNQMFEPIISEEWEIIFKSCSSWNLVDIEYLIMMSKCVETEKRLKEKYVKIEHSLIFDDIYYVKEKNNPLWYIVRSDWYEYAIPWFVEYEEKAGTLQVKRRDWKGFAPKWYTINKSELIEEKIDTKTYEENIELGEKYSKIEKEENWEYYLAQKKWDPNKRVILNKDWSEVKDIPPFEEYDDDDWEVLKIKIRENNWYKRYDVHRDPRELIENIYLNIGDNAE